MLNVLLINLMAALATGGAVVTAQMLGARDRDGARESVRQLLVVSVALSGLLMIAVLCCQEPLLRLVFGRVEDDVMQSALTYFAISAISYPFIALYNACAALFRSMGDSRTTMIVSAGMNVVNIAGNAVLVYGFHMGVAGVALPSLVSRALAAVVLLILLTNPTREIFLDWRAKWRLKWSLIRKILHIGIPNGLENSLFQMGRILVLSIITTFGTLQIAANQVANNLCALGCIPGQAIGLAMITVVGQCVGGGDYRQARRYTKRLLGTTYLVAGVLNALILLALPLLFQALRRSRRNQRAGGRPRLYPRGQRHPALAGVVHPAERAPGCQRRAFHHGGVDCVHGGFPDRHQLYSCVRLSDGRRRGMVLHGPRLDLPGDLLCPALPGARLGEKAGIAALTPPDTAHPEPEL